MSVNSNNYNLGNISLDNEVIKEIALKAAIEIQGIHKIEEDFINKIWNFLIRKGAAHGVRLEFTNDSEVKITLKVGVEYGVNIPHVAGMAQESIKKAVEYMTGIAVTEVAIKIIEVQTKKDLTLKEELVKETADL